VRQSADALMDRTVVMVPRLAPSPPPPEPVQPARNVLQCVTPFWLLFLLFVISAPSCEPLLESHVHLSRFHRVPLVRPL